MGKNTVIQNIAVIHKLKKKKHHGFLFWRFISTKIENVIWNRFIFTHNKLFARKEHFAYLKQAARKIVAEVASGRGTTISRIYKSLVYVSSKKTMA
jgi:fructosamine-3-kinase